MSIFKSYEFIRAIGAVMRQLLSFFCIKTCIIDMLYSWR